MLRVSGLGFTVWVGAGDMFYFPLLGLRGLDVGFFSRGLKGQPSSP